MDKVIEAIASKIVAFLVINNHLPKEKEDIYRYSTLITIQSAINIFSTLLLGVLFNKFFENICFFIVFKFLRKYSGGLHSTKFSTCFLISVVSNVVVLLLIRILDVYPNYVLAMIFEVVSFALVLAFAPVMNINKSFSQKEHKVFKLVATFASAILLIGSFFLMQNNCHLIFAMSLAMLLNGLLIVIEKVKKFFSK